MVHGHVDLERQGERMAEGATKRDATPSVGPGVSSGIYPRGEQRHEAHHEDVKDEYDPDDDVVAPISIRTSFMELIWICGDCGEHYPRSKQCPESCTACGGPRQHFYAPTED
jgi:rubrerythrin